MSTDYNKKRYLQLLDQRDIGDNSNYDELSAYSIMLTSQLDWEIRDQYLSLMENLLNGNIAMLEFFAELRIKNDAIIDAVTFLEKHRILLSVDKKASKFGELIEDVTVELGSELLYTEDESPNSEDEFTNFIQENYIKIKKYLDEQQTKGLIYPVFQAINMGLDSIDQKSRFIGIDQGPKSMEDVIHLQNFQNIRNKGEIPGLMQAVLDGAEQVGYTDGILFLNYE